MSSSKAFQQFLMWLSTPAYDRYQSTIKQSTFLLNHFLIAYLQANFDRRATIALLEKESSTYSSRMTPPTKKMSTSNSTGSNKSSPSSPHPPRNISNGTGISHQAGRVPPAIPATPPVGSGYTSPPVYNSPLYRPDIDLSLPPQVIN